MANIIKIKRSATTATPAALAEGELAYSENSGNLFIGTNGGVDVSKIGGNTDVLKLDGIEAGAQVNTVDSVNGQTGVVSLGLEDLNDAVFAASPNLAIDDLIIYDGANWVNIPKTDVGVTSHNDLTDIGTNTHAQIDTHMVDGTIHFTMGAISITKSQVSDFTETDYVHTTGIETIGGAKTFSDDMVINGDLTVNGTTTTVDSDNLIVTDNMITINNGEIGAGVTLGAAGIEVDRGTEGNTQLIWDESVDLWGYKTNVGSPLTGTFVAFSDENHNHDGYHHTYDSTIDGGTF